MAATPSLKVVKEFTYRGVTRRWSNRYHFNGGTPANSSDWTTLSDAVVTAEKAALLSTGNLTTIVETIGYAAGSDVPVFSKTYTTAGTFNPAGNPIAPGDCALLVRYATTARTAKNHPVYLWNYYHGVALNGPSAPDTPLIAQRTALGTYATAWLAGFSDGTNTLVRAGPNGATATGQLVETAVRHRDFPNG